MGHSMGFTKEMSKARLEAFTTVVYSIPQASGLIHRGVCPGASTWHGDLLDLRSVLAVARLG